MDENKKTEMINFDKEKDLMLTFATSKGNLPKWHIGDYWYKVDSFGYENLAECVISDLLEYSNVDNYVHYDLIKGILDNEVKNFSMSKSFIKGDETLITFYKLYFLNTNKEITKDIVKYNDISERIKYVIDFIHNMPGGVDISKELTKTLEIDMFFLNEDRHFNNLALIRKSDKYFSYAPIFDNGSTLLKEQCMAAESLYGQQLHFNFSNNDIQLVLEKYKDYYDDTIIKRVETILYEQRRKYSYLFS